MLLFVHCGSRFAAGEVNAEEQAPPGTAGQRMLIVRWPDDTESEVPRFYADEILISEGDLVGKTQEQVRAVGHPRDVEYLRDLATARPPGPFATYLAWAAARASMRAGSPTAGVSSRIRRSSASTSSPRREGLVSAAMSVAASCAGSSAEACSSSA